MNRRSFVNYAASSFLGVTALPIVSNRVTAAQTSSGVKAKSVISIFFSGGLTHIDTFDPKPNAGADIVGQGGAIGTNVAGIQIGKHFPLLAQQMDKIALIRNMNSTQGAHEQGRYFMRTGYTMRSNMQHPTVGSWSSRLSGISKTSLPGYVAISPPNEHPGQGFLNAEHAALPVNDPSQGLKNSRRLRGTSEKAFLQQIALREKLDASLTQKYSSNKSVQAYESMLKEAVKLMNSKDLAAFNIMQESKATHELYGSESFSKGALLARRLVQYGVQYVDLDYGGLDWHDDLFEQADRTLPMIDQALAALLHDLHTTGLLENTLVTISTEFGRTPIINENSGRDHFPKAFTTFMAGAGIKGGFVHGETNDKGTKVLGNTTSAGDFNATIGHLMGLPWEKEVISPNKRPFKLGGKSGQPIQEILA